MILRAVAIGLALFWVWGCDRETVPAASSRSAARPEAPAPSSRPEVVSKPPERLAATPRRCVLPSPENPPPQQTPAAQCPRAPSPDPALPRVSVTFVDAPSAPEVSVENATTQAEQARGLMYRTKLGTDDGMLFSWTNERVRSFWMKNTCIPLDMLFIAGDGTIAGILEQVPVMNQAPRSVRCPAKYVLEMNAGWTRRHGIVAGQKVVIGE